MTNIAEQSQQEMVVDLGTHADIAGAAKLAERLTGILGTHRQITLDASRIESVDAATLQLLTAFFVEAQSLGASIHWNSPSKAFRLAAELLGIATPLLLDAS